MNILYNINIKIENKKEDNDDYTMYITTSLFTNFMVAVLSTATFYTFLKRADRGLAFNFI